MDNGIIFTGMDLGSFKTAVASSTGTREVLYTAVGWPKDEVAHKLLGRDVIFGKEIMEQRLALNVIRPFEQGALKYLDHVSAGITADNVTRHEEAAKLLVEHAVSLTRPPAGVPIYGVIGAPARASVANKQVILEAARDAFEAVVIVSEPFAVAYGMNQLSDTLVIDIGAGTIDLCVLYGTFPTDEDQITLPIGGDKIDTDFLQRMQNAHPEAQLSTNMAREIKEKHGFVHGGNERAVCTLPVKGKPKQFDVTDHLKQACCSIVQPIIESLAELIGRCDPEFQQRLLKNVVLCGGGSQLKGLDQLIEHALKDFGGGKVSRVTDAVYAGAFGALKLAMNMPLSYWKKLESYDGSKVAA